LHRGPQDEEAGGWVIGKKAVENQNDSERFRNKLDDKGTLVRRPTPKKGRMLVWGEGIFKTVGGLLPITLPSRKIREFLSGKRKKGMRCQGAGQGEKKQGQQDPLTGTLFKKPGKGGPHKQKNTFENVSGRQNLGRKGNYEIKNFAGVVPRQTKGEEEETQVHRV